MEVRMHEYNKIMLTDMLVFMATLGGHVIRKDILKEKAHIVDPRGCRKFVPWPPQLLAALA